MKPSEFWNQKEPLIRPLVILAGLFITSLVLVVYQFKDSIVHDVPLGSLFWANVIVTVVLFAIFQAMAIICNVRIRNKARSQQV